LKNFLALIQQSCDEERLALHRANGRQHHAVAGTPQRAGRYRSAVSKFRAVKSIDLSALNGDIRRVPS
jgi:hypothetical protein